MKTFFHSADLDGHASGAIIRYMYPECKMIGIDHGEKFPWDTIYKNETVYMVDFSLQPFEDMLKLNKICNLIWIDHHKSSIEEYEKQEEKIKGLRKIGIGACALVWNFLFYDMDVPYGIKLLAEYDVWNHEDKNAIPFQYGLRMEDTLPESKMWKKILPTNFPSYLFIDSMIKNGNIILNYINPSNEVYAKGCCFTTELDGLKCIAINRMFTSSQLFDSIWNPKKFDAMLTFGWKKDKWTVSLYTDKKEVDVSIIAKNRGGGGHEGAAGFQCNELPFKLGK